MPLKFSYATKFLEPGNSMSYKPKWGLLVELYIDANTVPSFTNVKSVVGLVLLFNIKRGVLILLTLFNFHINALLLVSCPKNNSPEQLNFKLSKDSLYYVLNSDTTEHF